MPVEFEGRSESGTLFDLRSIARIPDRLSSVLGASPKPEVR